MFGMGGFSGMFDDPFYSMQEMHRQQMQRMNEMMANPYGDLAVGHVPLMMAPPMAITDGRGQIDYQRHAQAQMAPGQDLYRNPFAHLSQTMAVTDSQRRDRDYQRRGERHLARNQQDLFRNPFAHMSQMMAQMQNGMHGNMQGMTADPNGQFYSSSSYMSYSNTGDGAPHVYQASSSTQQGPGGVKETRKAVRDSRAGVEKMAIGRHINDRAHIVSKSRNMHSRDMEENQDFINLDEEEAESFNNEWKQKASRYAGGQRQGGRHIEGQRRPQHTPALEYPGEN